MKKSYLLLSLTSLMALAGCSIEFNVSVDESSSTTHKVAMITDYGDITDQSFNQATYEGAKEWCDANSVEFKYYKPTSNSDADRIASTEKAIDEGYDVIIMPGYAFAPTIEAVAAENADVKFIALDVAKGDLLAAHFTNYDYNPDSEAWASYQLPSNVYCAVYQEELCGYMAGYAAVKEGYTKLGFLGGMAVPAVVRYGYGFVQGCNDAAAGAAIDIVYAYGNQFYGDADITARTDTWYGDGTQVVFACGGGIYTSACESAKKINDASGKSEAKVIGVDVDQSVTIDTAYGAGMCITSAMKGLSATVKDKLTSLFAGNFESKIETLGLVSATDTSKNYVQLPTATWSMTKFTVSDYNNLVKDIFEGTIKVSNDTTAEPKVAESTKVTYQGNIK